MNLLIILPLEAESQILGWEQMKGHIFPYVVP